MRHNKCIRRAKK